MNDSTILFRHFDVERCRVTPGLATLAATQVGRCLRYTGRRVSHVPTEAHGAKVKFTECPADILHYLLSAKHTYVGRCQPPAL
jgi:hypothetical protein